MRNEQKLQRMSDILTRHGFWTEPSELAALAESGDCIELVAKSYGDSHSACTDEVLKDDYDELAALAEEVGIGIPDEVWFD